MRDFEPFLTESSLDFKVSRGEVGETSQVLDFSILLSLFFCSTGCATSLTFVDEILPVISSRVLLWTKGSTSYEASIWKLLISPISSSTFCSSSSFSSYKDSSLAS
jgi:hypothetical protein